MNDSIKRISLDLHTTSSRETVKVKRTDTGRKIYVSLVDGGMPYHISDDCYAVFTATKPDGHKLLHECTIDGCVIIYEMKEQTTAVAGTVDCEIRLYGTDNKLITSPSFYLLVDDTVYDVEDEIESTDDFSALTALTSQVQTLKEEVAAMQTKAAALQEEASALQEEAAAQQEEAAALQEEAAALREALKDTTALLSKIEQLEEEIADLKYVPIDIEKFTLNPSTAEIGSKVTFLMASWQLNKTPKSLVLNEENLDTSLVANAYSYSAGITEDVTFTLQATDERGATDSATGTLRFLKGVYYGVLEDGAAIDSAAVLSLTKKLQSAKALTFTADAGSSQRLCYAAPSRYGTPVFNIGGFDYEWEKTTIQFTNASGYTENYDVWLSGQTGLGSTTVKVS